MHGGNLHLQEAITFLLTARFPSIKSPFLNLLAHTRRGRLHTGMEEHCAVARALSRVARLMEAPRRVRGVVGTLRDIGASLGFVRRQVR